MNEHSQTVRQTDRQSVSQSVSQSVIDLVCVTTAGQALSLLHDRS